MIDPQKDQRGESQTHIEQQQRFLVSYYFTLTSLFPRLSESVCLNLSVYLSIYLDLSVSVCVCLSVYLSVFISLSVRLYVYLSVCISFIPSF